MNRVALPLLIVTGLGCLPLASSAENWPRFRGPNGSGISSDTAVPLTWSESENLKWKLDLPGPGSSSPIVWGDKVLVTCYSGYGDGSGEGDLLTLNRHLLCIDANSGTVIWEKTIPAPLPEDPFQGFISEHGYASHTPVTDGEIIFAYFGKGGVIAYDFEGKELWRKDTGARPSSKGWGTATSPIVHGDNVIVNAAEESNTIFAFNKATGDEVWKQEAESLVSLYGAPLISKVSDEREDLIVSVPGEIWGMNPGTGKLRWFAEMDLTGNLSASPVLAGERIIQFGGYPRTMGIGVKIGGQGDVTQSHRLWQNNDAKSYITAPVFHEDHLYWVSDAGISYCANPDTGELLYEKRLDGASGQGGRGKPFYASPVLVNGHVLAVSRTAGTFVIVAKPEFEQTAKNIIAGDDSRFQGTPAISGGKLFLRSEKALYCIGSE